MTLDENATEDEVSLATDLTVVKYESNVKALFIIVMRSNGTLGALLCEVQGLHTQPSQHGKEIYEERLVQENRMKEKYKIEERVQYCTWCTVFWSLHRVGVDSSHFNNRRPVHEYKIE